MLKGSINGQFYGDKTGATSAITANAGELKLKASLSDITSSTVPSFSNLSFSVEKPGSFFIDYDVPKQDVRFQFMNSGRVLDKQLNLTYTHSIKENNCWMDGMLMIDSSNKLSANYKFDCGLSKLKYCYSQGGGVRTFESCYAVADKSWDFAVSQRVCGNDLVRASYQTSSKNLGLAWLTTSSFGGCFKVSASVNLAEESKIPKLSAESTWDLDM
ncbi:outer envelope pore protein 24A, chloroplastic-like [Amaranthus tricolor]|uniref:outer envelope pore protein 24A, chloroplastic-like n=1 Tax=Amaranthus tricolor TaxID=29722 RepID=UPI00258C8733|nr:outer envelope pore protein 24A, chloroplastic-like [Amaranthus tricolor]